MKTQIPGLTLGPLNQNLQDETAFFILKKYQIPGKIERKVQGTLGYSSPIFIDC